MQKVLEQAKAWPSSYFRRNAKNYSSEPRERMSPYAPRVETMKINPDKIRDVIGKGGETINKIIAETGAEIDIKDDGTVFIASPDEKSIDATRVLDRNFNSRTRSW